METYTIKITGTGTPEELLTALLEISNNLRMSIEWGTPINHELPDSILTTEITKDENISGDLLGPALELRK